MTLESLCDLLQVTPRAIRQWRYADSTKTSLWITGSIRGGFKDVDVVDFVRRNPKYLAQLLVAAFAPDDLQLLLLNLIHKEKTQ